MFRKQIDNNCRREADLPSARPGGQGLGKDQHACMAAAKAASRTQYEYKLSGMYHMREQYLMNCFTESRKC